MSLTQSDKASRNTLPRSNAFTANGGKSIPAVPVLQQKSDWPAEEKAPQMRVGSITDHLQLPQLKGTVQSKEDAGQMKSFGIAPPVQKKNNTGLPSNLKSGVENLSGYSLDDVKVHYNSAEPAQLQAFAYARGSDIYVGPGQEKHLPHEAWHVVQQKQGRVEPTLQMKKNVKINDDAALENEADLMGAKALNLPVEDDRENNMNFIDAAPAGNLVQRAIANLSGPFPAMNEEIITGNKVFSGGSPQINLNMNSDDDEEDDTSFELILSQDYLNTELSKKYKADPSGIAGGAAELFFFDEDKKASVVEGNHRAVWSLYHTNKVKFQQKEFGSKTNNIAEMKYQDTPQSQPETVEKKV